MGRYVTDGYRGEKSCLEVSGHAGYNKCLLANCLDGKNKAVVVKNAEGKIIGRAIIRILIDENQRPVMHLEKPYTAIEDPVLYKLLQEGAKRKAKEMGLQLVASEYNYPIIKTNPVYPSIVQSLEGPVPFEYVDSMGREPRRKGIFRLPKDTRIVNVAVSA